MRIERHSVEFDIHHRFPGATEFHCGEGEVVYLADMNGMFYVIVDSRALLDVLSEQDRNDLSDVSVAVYEFQSEHDRAEYVTGRKLSRNVR